MIDQLVLIVRVSSLAIIPELNGPHVLVFTSVCVAPAELSGLNVDLRAVTARQRHLQAFESFGVRANSKPLSFVTFSPQLSSSVSDTAPSITSLETNEANSPYRSGVVQRQAIVGQ